MRRGLKRGLSLFVVVMMLVGMVPVSAMAKEATTSESPVVQQNSNNAASAGTQSIGTQSVNVSETIATLDYQGFQYREETGGIILISYSGKLNETKILKIPEKINEKPVIKIGKEAFKDNAEIKEVMIPRGITDIDETAFDGCINLEKITVDDNNTVYDDQDGKLVKKETDDLAIELENSPGDVSSIPNATKDTALIQEQTTNPPKQEISQNTMTTEALQTTATENGFVYIEVAGGVSIIKYTGTLTQITIPNTLGGKKVVEVGANAFSGQTRITKLILGSNVLSIDKQAFSECSGLTAITFNNGLTTIGDGAFYRCDGLTTISIPDSVTTLGTLNSGFSGGIFGWCDNLKSVSIGKGIVSIPNDMFRSCFKLETVAFNGLVKIIGDNAFSGTGLHSITLPEGLEKIGDDAFDCSALYKIVIPASVTSIGDYAFSNYHGLSIYGTKGSVAETYANGNKIPFVDLANPNKSDFLYEDIEGGVRIVRYIGNNSAAVIPATLEGKKVVEIGETAFTNQNFIVNVTLGSNVLKIGDSAFVNCSGLTSVILNSGLKTIGILSFKGCKALIDITIPDSVTTFGDSTIQSAIDVKSGEDTSGVFSGCDSLKTLTLGSGIISIPSYMAYNCSKLETVSFKGKITTIGDSAFRKCTSLTNISIPESVTSIGYEAFSSCSGLTSISIPGSVMSIGDYAFERCASLTSVSIPESVTSIGNYVFTDCDKLSRIDIPESVTSIGESVFANSPLIKIYGVMGSYTQTYATKNSIPFVSTGAPALSVMSFSSNKTTGQYMNTDINLTAAGTGGTTPYQYKFYYKLGTTTVVIKTFSSTNTATFKPITAGTYTLYVDIKDAGGKTATKAISNYLVYETLSVKSLTADKASGQNINTAIKLTAAGAGGKIPYQYKFYYKLGTVTTTIQDYSATASATFKPTKVGTYTLYVDVKDAGGKVATKSIANYIIVNNPVVKSFTSDKATGQYVNTAINLNATGTAGTPAYQYKFYYKLGTTTVVLKDFSAANMATFKPTTAGTYTLYVQIKDAAGKIGTKVIPNYVVYSTPSVKSFTTDKASGQTINTAIKLTAAGTGGKTPYLYKFYYKLGTVTTTIHDFSVTPTGIFKPTKAGTYTLYVDVKDANGKISTKSITSYMIK